VSFFIFLVKLRLYTTNNSDFNLCAFSELLIVLIVLIVFIVLIVLIVSRN